MKVKSAENRAEQPEQRLSVQLNGFIPNASVSVVHFLLTPFVTPPVRGTRCDGASKRGGTARLSHCFLVGTHPSPEPSAREDDPGWKDVRQAVSGKVGGDGRRQSASRLPICFRQERCQLTSERPISHDLDQWAIAIHAHFRKYHSYTCTLYILFSHLQICERDYTQNVRFSHLSILAPAFSYVTGRQQRDDDDQVTHHLSRERTTFRQLTLRPRTIHRTT